jgi:PTS system mannose-specific IID component
VREASTGDGRERVALEAQAGSRGRRVAFRRAFLRTFAIQGSWNYRTMLGTGFGFAILPILRRVYRDDPEGFQEAVTRHSEHFNAHPFLTGMALGAVGRLEKDGESPEMIRRFKLALKGPLGSLGDRLVWAAWLPLSGVVGLTAAMLSDVWWVGPAAMLGFFNVGHLGLRYWAYRTGVREGRNLGARIRQSAITRWASTLVRPTALGLGLLIGLILGNGIEAGLVPWPWLLPGAVLFALGLRFGDRAWKPSTVTFVLVLIVVLAYGAAA